jgi:hypothetical protein
LLGSSRSSTLGLLRLSCWFTTVQEIVSITMTIMDTKDYLRGGGWVGVH